MDNAGNIASSVSLRFGNIVFMAAVALLVAGATTQAQAQQYVEFHRDGGIYGTTWDTYIDENAKSTNYFSSTYLYTGGAYDKTIMICFPYIIDDCASNAIPPGAKIDNAVLTLFTASSGSLDNHYIVRMLTEWVPTTVTFNSAHTRMDWSNGHLTGGIDFYFHDQEPVVPASAAAIYTFNATEIVQAWADGQPNCGFAIGGAQDDWASWWPENTTTEANRPKLEVWFSLPTGNVTTLVADTSAASSCQCTYIRSDMPDFVCGDQTDMMIQSDGSGHLKKALITWPNFIGLMADQVQSGSTVYYARQSLYAVGSTIESLSIYRVLLPWDEYDVTWNFRAPGNPWATAGMKAGADYFSIPSGGVVTPGYTPGYYSHTLTRDVSAWVKGVEVNYGWVIQIEDADPVADSTTLYTEDNLSPQYRPSLCVLWGNPTGNVPPGPPTNVITPTNGMELPFWDIRYASMYNDEGPGGVQAVRYRAQVSAQSDFSTIFWDSGVPFVGPLNPTEMSPWLDHTGPTPPSDTTYYFRMRYYTNLHDESAWSVVKEFNVVESMQACNRKGYHLLELFADTESRTAAELFGDNVSPLYIYGYDEVSREWVTPTTLDVGKGYFIWSPTDSPVYFGANGLLLDNNAINIPLSYTNIYANTSDGWNLVRNPYYTDGTPLDSETHIDSANMDTVIYRPWDGNQYGWFNFATTDNGGSGTREIPPGASFWVRASAGGAYIDLYHPRGGGAPSAPKPVPPPVAKWRMPVEAATGSHYDTATYIAVREDASEQHDYADVLQMAPMSSYYIRTYFEHDDWGGYSGKYTQDTRPVPVDGESVTWTATVETNNASGTVEIGWEIPVEASNWDFTMRDETSGTVVDLKESSTYSYAASGVDTRNLTITVTRRGSIVLGDVDGDGDVTIADAVLAAQNEHGLVTLDAGQKARADLDCSGDVDVLDALVIRKLEKEHIGK